MSGFEKLLLLVTFAQVGLTLGVLFYLGKLRVPPVLSGDIKVADIALDAANWPELSQQVSINSNCRCCFIWRWRFALRCGLCPASFCCAHLAL